MKLCLEIDLFLMNKAVPELEKQLALSTLSVIATQKQGLQKDLYLQMQNEIWEMLK